jgi:hypothetical protein
MNYLERITLPSISTASNIYLTVFAATLVFHSLAQVWLNQHCGGGYLVR